MWNVSTISKSYRTAFYRNKMSTTRSCPNKKGAAHHCPSSVWIWRKTINPLLSYIKLQITPPSPLKVAAQNSGSPWRVNSADSGSPRGKHARNTRRLTWRGWMGDVCMRFGLAHFHNGYSFLMISPNLLDIWPVFFLILSCCGTLHFLIVIRTSGDGHSLLGSKK